MPKAKPKSPLLPDPDQGGVPEGLSPKAAEWWHALQADFPLNDSAGRLLLESALRAFDRAEDARRLIDAEGAVVRDRFDQAGPHPGVRIERDSRAQMLCCLKQLNLDIAPARPPGRPSGF